MSDLTAIDILINPDADTIKRAQEVNAKMLKSMPQGWALDDTHQPHITTLQRYVRTADLDKVYEAIEKTTIGTVELGAGKLSAADVIGQCKALAAVGVQHAIFNMPNVHESAPLEVFGREIIPAVAGF